MQEVLILGRGLLGAEIEKQTGWRCLSHDEFDVVRFEEHGEYPRWDEKVIINCIGYTRTYDQDKSRHEKMLFGVDNLINFCELFDKKLIHISTDYLYAGSVDYATEEDLPVPIKTWYGHYKLIADEIIKLRMSNYLICRGTHKPKPFRYELAWLNQVGNFDYVDVIARLIIKLIKKGAVGTYNVGTEEKTMYQLAMKTRHVKGVQCPLEIVPKNVTMNLDKLNSFLS